MAAVDVGANALRMVIAEVFSDGRIEVLERLQRAVRLGQDTFRRGRLGGESMRAAVQILRDYRQLLDLYKVERVRAVPPPRCARPPTATRSSTGCSWRSG